MLFFRDPMQSCQKIFGGYHLMNKYLLTPGPVPVSCETQLAEARPLIGHRGKEFSELFSSIKTKLSELLKTDSRNDYYIDFNPHGQLLMFQNHDRPGVIGKVGNLLGKSSVNIANFSLGRKEMSGLALAVMEVDGVISNDQLSEMAHDGDMIWAATVKLNGEEE
jgi:hypothetical protein